MTSPENNKQKSKLTTELFEKEKINKVNVTQMNMIQGGKLSPEFSQFYVEVREAILQALIDNNYDNLYRLSDHIVSKEKFIQYFRSTWAHTYYDMTKNSYNVTLSLEIDGDYSKESTRDILGSFLLTGFILEKKNSGSGLEKFSTGLKTIKGSLWFSEDEESFFLITHFMPLNMDLML